jgi:hypothetical protein
MTQPKDTTGLTGTTDGEIPDDALASIDGGTGRAAIPNHQPLSWSDVVTDPDLVVPHDLSLDAFVSPPADASAPPPAAPAPELRGVDVTDTPRQAGSDVG